MGNTIHEKTHNASPATVKNEDFGKPVEGRLQESFQHIVNLSYHLFDLVQAIQAQEVLLAPVCLMPPCPYPNITACQAKN